MLRIVLAALYTALLFGANITHADQAAAAAVLAGDMRKLQIHETPVPVPAVGLLDMDEAPRALAEWHGRWVVVNFWATWCAPCRKEMPSLDRLSAASGETGVDVVTIATGRNPVPAMQKFLTEIDARNLVTLRDPKSQLARAMGILGLPLTVILNPEGQEVARLIGDAEWDSADAKAALTTLVAP